MSKFATHGVLSASTGRLMGDIGELYKVMSFLLGRAAYTHELAYYGGRAARALKAAHPELPGHDDFEHVTQDNYKAVRDEWEAKLGGPTFALNDSLRECLADEKNALDTANEMAPGRVVVVPLKENPPHD